MQRIKIKNIILIILTIIISTLIPAIIFNKWPEAITFFFCHWFIREQYPKQYHHIVAAVCRTITASAMFFGVSFVLPFSLSLLSAIPICYFISWIGYEKVLKNELEIKCEEQELELYELAQRLKKYKNIDLFNMTEEQLRNYAKSKGLSESICDTLVLKIIHNYRWVDIQNAKGYTKDGIRYHKDRIIEKLEVEF